MLRRKTLPNTADNNVHGTPSPLSNYSVRFAVNRDDVSDEFVDITPDVVDAATAAVAAAVEKPSPPTTLPNLVERPSAPATVALQQLPSSITAATASQIRPPNGSAPSSPSMPRSPVSSPLADRVSSLRENLHNLKDRFHHHHHKNSDDKEKLLPSQPASEATTSSHGSGSPSIIGKIVRKIEDRRSSGSHSTKLHTHHRGSSPATTKELERLSNYDLILTADSCHKLGSDENISVFPGDNLSVQSEPIFHDALGPNPDEVPVPIRPCRKKSASMTIPAEPPLSPSEHVLSEIMPPKASSNQTPLRDSREPVESPTFSLHPMAVVVGLLIAVVIVPMPGFMSGLLFGCILTATASVRIWFTVLFPKQPPELHRLTAGPPSIVRGDPLTRFPKPKTKDSGEPPSTWMNQMVGDFDIATFHVNQTQSVYVSLDGSDLRIRKPKARILPRRAMYDEELKSKTFTFTESRIYNIAGADVQLVPPDIPRKRRWLWRFPIGIKLVDPTSIATLMEEVRDTAAKQQLENEKEKDKHKDKDKDDDKEKSVPQKIAVKESVTLYLLPRSDREKEDWYWRIVAATGKQAFPIQRPNLSPNLSTLNLLFHRIGYDVLVESMWKTVIKKKIQKKLSIIKLPFYIEELQITDMDLGKHLPVISDVSKQPDIDARGIWVEMNFEYHGTVQMTLATKLNLMRLKKDKDDDQDGRDVATDSDVHMETLSVGSVDSIGAVSIASRDRAPTNATAGNLYESDESDEFEDNTAAVVAPPTGGKQKLMHYVEKITESKAFQKFTDVGIVRRAMENVSETDLTLTVVVERLAGRLAINLPHPPSDKLWYGFVVKPDLHLKAFPKLGEREVTFNQVTDWIEKKLTSEFHRLITVPNMDDLTIPVMNSALDDPEFRLTKLSDLVLK